MTSMFGGMPEETWLRRDTESDQAFEAFEVYKGLGLKRSLVKAAHELGKSAQLLEEWSRKHEWRRRVTDWDRHASREINKELIAGRADFMRRNAQVAGMIAARAATRIMNMTAADIAGLTPVQAAMIFRVASEVEAKMRNIDEDQGETQPFQVVVNVIEDRGEDMTQLLEAASRVAPPPAQEPMLNVIRG